MERFQREDGVGSTVRGVVVDAALVDAGSEPSMPKTLPLLAAVLLTLPATVAFAQDDSAQVERQEIMEDLGDAMGVLG